MPEHPFCVDITFERTRLREARASALVHFVAWAIAVATVAAALGAADAFLR